MVVTISSTSSPEEIKAALEKIEKASDNVPKKHFDAFKYCGVISLKEDALAIQKEMRSEWE
jgi:hypothetical protein